MYDFLVFIGRFQPFHVAHLAVIREALRQAREVIVLVGSAGQSRNLRNPFTVDARMAMIRACLTEDEKVRVHLQPLRDSLYDDDRWVEDVRTAVAIVLERSARGSDSRVGLIGHDKDDTTYYLSLFPGWGSVPVDNIDAISATPLRTAYLLGDAVDESRFPEGALRFLQDFRQTKHWSELQAEARFVREYKAAWNKAPYPPVFVTVDAVVVCNDHILLIERGGRPGVGQWALPGGFLDQEETLQSASLRELNEETCLEVPRELLKASLAGVRAFDDPYRSVRGRTITHAFHYDLPVMPRLPAVNAADDARAAFWVPLSEVTPERMFEDHYHIIRVMTGRL
ncbi:bifunctional NMN adenylyltransferase/nudix hydrolase [Fluviicoccus keumensis]|uniref:Bifunctional NMN adenylyltransferase/nudix hydrolase n=1 Tax=Fluviicoccus keumensis TaxID=1435465 RepID=A0A4Q7ZAB9_9GAMM|nr:bifunctional nicotinamide-nucleotide adenylyltransferase/Nudix hydroxylase [Fluviicoccus keumensis]RZU47054.1 bifunctional NMN adenylyltransferase/nudix hydrolase [Fluviicoccus keumensis]